MTERQRLLEHIEAMHPTARRGWTHAQLVAWHARQHHRYHTNHHHAGVNTGPSQRPPGWYTGADAVPNKAAPL